MIGATLAAFLLAPIGIEPPKTADPRPSASSSGATSSSKPQADLSAAFVGLLEHLSKMSGEERAIALADLPPVRRARIEKGLEQLDALTPQRRQEWFDRYQAFSQLPPEKKEKTRKVMNDLAKLPPSRSKAVREEIDAYRHMPMWAREARMKTVDFKNKFNGEEREILRDAALLLHDPAAQESAARETVTR